MQTPVSVYAYISICSETTLLLIHPDYNVIHWQLKRYTPNL